MSLFLNENPLKHQGYELDIHKDIFHVQYFFGQNLKTEHLENLRVRQP